MIYFSLGHVKSFSNSVSRCYLFKYLVLCVYFYVYHIYIICLLSSRRMLSAAHVLAMDSKNLLDVIDGVRVKHGLATFLPAKHSAV